MYKTIFIVFTLLIAYTYGAPPKYGFPKRFSQGLEETAEPFIYQYTSELDSKPKSPQEEINDGQIIARSYKVALPDGRIQAVDYKVDGDNEFIANVRYEDYSGNELYPKYP
ncbi:unnamed protein product [Lepeophtheirus salmonis]|uniref:(salmon louse) hypothetical protein n=1 Tax=Lepeophtheirus salmonis TaxID=72036 RepID=A0A7R8CHZ3_LEPSM|nr:unnamed protein product [Lepeophtheirus salmonis]CAF2823110.1 unnamed protein product [Lepeophtheirus salmonis]